MQKKEKRKAQSKAPADKEIQQQQQYSTLREYFVATVYCTIIALFVTTYVVHPMTVPTPSMEPTILVGDRLLIDKFTYRNAFMWKTPLTPAHDIQRGDIVVFKFPEKPEVLYVKRAIGMPGETIQIIDKTVYINGNPLDEPYTVHSDPTVFRQSRRIHFLSSNSIRDNFGPLHIPQDHFFMMGDNRDRSADSRFWGFVNLNKVKGKAFLIYWSWGSFMRDIKWRRIGTLIR
mgnify:CR=1 FL=1